MATKLQILHNLADSGATPASLSAGELAVNVVDKKLWVGDGINPVPLTIAGPGAVVSAADVTYDNSGSDLAATNVKAALDEVDTDVNNAEASITVNAGNISTNTSNIMDITDGTSPPAEAGNADTVDTWHVVVGAAGVDANTIYFVPV